MGLTVDHVFAHCPALKRSLPELRRVGWDKQGNGELDVLGTDVCGWCVRVWRASEHGVAL